MIYFMVINLHSFSFDLTHVQREQTDGLLLSSEVAVLTATLICSTYGNLCVCVF